GCARLRVRRPRGDGGVRAGLPRGRGRDADVALLRPDHRARARGGEGARGARLALPDGAHVRGLGPRARPRPARGACRAVVQDRAPARRGSAGGAGGAGGAGAPRPRERGGGGRMRLGRVAYGNWYPGSRALVRRAATDFARARAEAGDLDALARLPHDGGLVIGDAALVLAARQAYPHRYDLGSEWKRRTGLPFVFAVWAARREADPTAVRRLHAALLASRAWGLAHLPALAAEAHAATGVPLADCLAYFEGLDYAFTERHQAGLVAFFRKLAAHGL